MASHRERFSSGGTLVEGKKGDGIFVFDRRKGDSDEVSLELDGLTNFKTFRDKIRQVKYPRLLCLNDDACVKATVKSLDEAEGGII